jgi:HD-GYP domain-containing protein (c-di-GMP phosphodiesterase class II)
VDELNLLKSTIRGLNYRYSGLKKINSLMGECEDSKDFLDKMLGILMEIFEAEAGAVLIRNKDSLKVEAFRAELPFKKEETIKKNIEQIEITGKDEILGDMLSGNKNFHFSQDPDISMQHRSLIQSGLRKISGIAAVAIKTKNRATGIMELYNFSGAIGDDKKEALESMGGEIGIAMELFDRLSVLKERTRALRKLTSITEAISFPHQLNMILDMIMKNSVVFFNADGCSVLLKDDKGRPEFVAVSGTKADMLRGKKLEKGEGLVGWVINKGKAVLIESVEKDKRFSPRIDSMTKMVSGSILCAPLKIVDDIIGVIEIVRSREKLPFNEEDMGLLVIMASHAAIAIEKARLYSHKDLWFKSTVDLLSRAIDTKNRFFPGHSQMVKKYVTLLGAELRLNSNELECLDLAASIQDIGKLTIPDKILEKQDELSKEELDEIRAHPVKSIEILERVEEFKEIIPIIKYHHEKYDGSGYPEGLSGEEIPKLARILAVADAYSAMICPRPYREPMQKQEAVKSLKAQKSTQFDPEFINAFLKVLEQEQQNV